ncbi:MAG: 3-dehydroquinate synthase [Candidatus Omnitrophota bacterium]
METIEVKLGKRSYRIRTGFGVIKSLGRDIRRHNLGTDAFIITNNRVKQKYAKSLIKPLKESGINCIFKTVADSEKSKSLESCLGVIRELARFDRKRKVFVIAFGGGVIGDLSGFISAIYKRGVPYIQIPTTLLACVDSSIGGKTGVDLKSGKNLVGAFYQPRFVLSELTFLKSLSSRQVRAGLAEVIKYAIIKDKNLFEYLEKNYPKIIDLQRRALEFVVNRCAQIKAGIIQRDEREKKGIRTILNFGHTLGHAIETAGNYQKYNHGEAVALGMVLAAHISGELGLVKENERLRIENLIESAGLPVFIKGLSLKKIIDAYYRDKKFLGEVNRLVLIRDIGKTIIRQNVPLGIIKDSLASRSNL